VLIVAAIVLNSAWSGIEILVVGSAFWLSVLAFRKHSPLRLALIVFFILLLLTAFLVFSEQTFQTFHFRDFSSSGGSADFRWRIFRDTFRLIRDSPWCGIGFGNIESIFPIFRNASLSDPQALRPDSDWLRLWSELGWLAVVLAVLGIALLVRRVFPLQT